MRDYYRKISSGVKKQLADHEKVILFLIFCFGALLRFISMRKDVWLDEALSIYGARQSLPDLVHFAFTSHELQPPLYHLLLKPFFVFSSSVIIPRIVSLSCGLVIIYLTYKLGRLLAGKAVGLLACAFVAFSWEFVYYSVELRSYNLWVLTSILAVYYFMKALQDPLPKNVFLCASAAIISVYLHYFGIFIFVGIGGMLLMRRGQLSKEHVWMWTRIFFWSSICLLPQVVYGVLRSRGLSALAENYIGQTPAIRDVFGIFVQYSNNISLLVVLSIALFIFLVKNFNTFTKSPVFQPVIFFFCVPVAAIFAISQGKYCFFNERHLIPFFVFFYIIAGIALWGYNKKYKIPVVIIFFTVFFLKGLYSSIIIPHSNALQKVSSYLRPRLQSEDIVVANNVYRELQIFNDLNRPLRILVVAEDLQRLFFLRTFNFAVDEAITDFSPLQNKKRIWFISKKGEDGDPPWFRSASPLVLVDNMLINDYVVQLYMPQPGSS